MLAFDIHYGLFILFHLLLCAYLPTKAFLSFTFLFGGAYKGVSRGDKDQTNNYAHAQNLRVLHIQSLTR